MEQGDQSHNQTNTHLTDGSNAIPAEGVGRLPSRRRRNGRPERDSRKKSTFETHDHNSVGYEWLHPGWVAEVHETKLGRVYKKIPFGIRGGSGGGPAGHAPRQPPTPDRGRRRGLSQLATLIEGWVPGKAAPIASPDPKWDFFF
ncbi:hypothetical protein CRG98_007246 [Punica granatum]|uniref:Uncharacterized protein n=1 Tax=Punica granatum TaxID=22663 RepID=A0A2I0KX11_PUNGR|nr:hypothetical protein CRG98_007246 [Punica granatum]